MRAPSSRRALRERFADAYHPPTHRTPDTFHFDCYLATDGSYADGWASLGAVLESPDGRVLHRWSESYPAPDNNAAEVLAVHFGLDRLANTPAAASRIGLLLDHDRVGDAVAACASPARRTPRAPPCRSASPHHWGGITARIAGLPGLGVGVIASHENPAHEVAHRAFSARATAGGHT